MEMQEILGMNHGEGQFSYAHNSFAIPGKIFTHKIKPAVEKAIKYQLLRDITKQYKVLNVADLGSGVGPTPIALLATIMETVHNVYKEMKSENDDQVPEVQIYMSDLPSNDFNMLFKDAAKIQGQRRDGMPLCFVIGAPGSFHGRLFSTKSLHFVHSSSALHWLSQVPLGVYNEEGMAMNKKSILASETSTPEVVESYFAQFKSDFTSFLTCRSKEVVTDAYMLLSFPGRGSIKPCQYLFFTHLFQAFASLVSKGVITEEKLDSFNLPIYFPCKEEIEGIISEEGSFIIKNMEVTIEGAAVDIKDIQLRAEAIAKFLRCTTETITSYHFGAQIWDLLQPVLQQVILKHLNSINDPYHIPFLIILLEKKLD
ncbi:hypothetical protein RND81_10G198800 [Saponaria officinalis]|uniref:Uncharacterized protein n=1 Tax=Saponaria officinalis TaxID=3572 RepID=A0AAW1I5V4_SAPOF